MATPAIGLSIALKRNTHWKPNGPADYARSARKWSIKPTNHTTFFTHEGLLLRRGIPAHEKRHRSHDGLADRGGKKGTHETEPQTGTSTSGSEVPADDVQNDLEYVVPVTIGTPGVTLKLDFDTGSSDLWVWSSFLKTSSTYLKGHTVYDPSQSSTAKLASSLTWNISYGDGSSASGKVYDDTVALAELAIPGQAVEVATKLSSSFLTENGSDGLLGLAFPTINTVTPTQQKTSVEQLIEQNLIAQPIFTVKLDKGDSNGFYTFGYIDDTVLPASSTISYAPVDSSNGFWEFSSPELQVGDQIVTRPSGNTAIADTGTTLILLDDAAVQAIYTSIEGASLDNNAGGWIFPTSSSPPDLSFSVNGTFFSIPGDDLKFADAGNGNSFGSVQSKGQVGQDILGDVFLKRVYAVFDQTPGNPRIGFGQRATT